MLLALIVREHWRAYLIAFGLACLNKETTLVFVLVFAACAHGSLTTREYRKQIAKQLAVFAVVRGALMLTYARNPGSEVQHFFDYHLSMYSEFGTQAQYSLLGWLSLLFCVFYGFSHKPRALRLSLIGVPPIAALYLAFGYPFEWRVFYELLAPALLLALHGIYRLVARTDPQPLVA